MVMWWNGRPLTRAAKNGKDFHGGEGVLHFKHGETQRVSNPIVNDMEPERDENFEIELLEVGEGAKLGKVKRLQLDYSLTTTSSSVMR